ncbi:hypothetical protein AB0A95_30630 [Micromonospora sp. NPDC049230]|uniref:hypothetical protein n=1 Tax=Micromonospora sp. NPDC049230 TaxID=3155502 RepID=UPI003407DADF
MAEIQARQPGPDGIALGLAPAAAGDTAKPGNHRALLVLNGSGSPITVTIAVPGVTATFEPIPDNAVTVAANELRAIPLLGVYADPENNRLAAITWSSTTSVTRGVIQL